MERESKLEKLPTREKGEIIIIMWGVIVVPSGGAIV